MPRPKKEEINTNEDKIKKVTNKKSSTKKTKSSSNKNTKAKNTSSAKTKKSNKTTSTVSKTRTTKSTSTKNTKKNTASKKTKVEVVEYYDLPYRYNQTVVKVLYQTPTTLFIYWDISDNDRNKFIKQYGENFFNDTKPVLVIHNNTLHYSFEVEINDFANNWYLNVNDSNCKYSVELGRRAKDYNIEKHFNLPNNYLYITNSNNINTPNDHILFNKNMDTVYFKDIKTNIITSEQITSLSFIKNMGKIYKLIGVQTDYKRMDNNYFCLDLNNPGSGNPSSTFK